MADVTGTVYAEGNGARYPLRLTLRAVAALQGEFGMDVLERMQKLDVATFDFNIIVRVIELSLGAANPSLEPKDVCRIADEIGSFELFAEVLAGLFPDAENGTEDDAGGDRVDGKAAPGNGKRPKRAA